jgi:hypothetical protein
VELTYEILNTVVNLTHAKILSGDWTGKSGLVYLSENGINDKYSKAIVLRATNCHKAREAFENREKEPEEWDRKRKASLNPDLYQKATIPAIWERDLPLKLFIDTPMHLLFLGVVKAVFF